MSPPATELTAGLRAILERFPALAAAWLFGSAARGELRADSDVDIGVVFRDLRATAADQHRLLADLASQLPCSFLVTAHHPWL